MLFVNFSFLDLDYGSFFSFMLWTVHIQRVQCDHNIISLFTMTKVIYMVLLCPLFWPFYGLIIIYWRKRNDIRLALYVVLFMFQ